MLDNVRVASFGLMAPYRRHCVEGRSGVRIVVDVLPFAFFESGGFRSHKRFLDANGGRVSFDLVQICWGGVRNRRLRGWRT
jgi:hypothetical protein